MIDEFKKALSVKKHPGMNGRMTLPRLAWQAVPFVTSPVGKAKPPLTVYWSVNSVCNLYCKMCDVGMANVESNFFKNLRINGKLHEIAIDRFKSVIDEVAPYKSMISINSTEPLMYKPLGEAVAYARHCGLDVAVTTGGYLLPKRAEELAEAGLSRLNISIDGAPERHNKIRGRKDSFQKSAEGIGILKEKAKSLGRNIEVLANCTISNLNYDDLEDFYDSLANLPVDRINFTYYSFVTEEMAQEHNALWGDKYEATVNCLGDEAQPYWVDVDILHSQIQAVQAKDKEYKKVAFMPFFNKEQLRTYFHEPHKFMGQGRCVVNWFIAQIIADGDVIPYTRCYHIPLGNINQQSFMEIWNGEKAQAWRQDLRKYRRFPACTRCDQVY